MDPERLRAWRMKSNEERLELIKQEIDPNIDVAVETLRLWYRKKGARYGNMPYRYSNRYPDDLLLQLQTEFCLRLLGHLRRGDEVLYYDACTCHPWKKTGAPTRKVADASSTVASGGAGTSSGRLRLCAGAQLPLLQGH